jgi:hypothetical protein
MRVRVYYINVEECGMAEGIILCCRSKGTHALLQGDDRKVKHRQHVQQVSTEDGRAMAETLDMAFYETSAKDKSMVDEAFFALTRDIKARLGAACVRVCTGGWSCVCGCACARARAPLCPWLPFVLPPWILVQSTARSVLLVSRAL